METDRNPEGVTQRIDLDKYDMAKKRRIEEKKEGGKRKSEEPNHEKMKIVRSEGESQGQVNKKMDVDLILESEWEGIKDELRQEKIPLLMIEGSDMDKAIQAARIQDMLGEYYVWKQPKSEQSSRSLKMMNHIGGKGVMVGGIKVWSNSKSIERKLRDEVRRKEFLHSESLKEGKGRKWKEIIEEGILEEIGERESLGELNLVERNESKYSPGMLVVGKDD